MIKCEICGDEKEDKYCLWSHWATSKDHPEIPEWLKGYNPAKKPEVQEKIAESKRGEQNPSKRAEVREKISEAKSGMTPWWKKKGVENPTQKGREITWAEKISESHRGMRKPWNAGSENSRWKDGPSSKRIPFGDNWFWKREEALERDEHECVVCGEDELVHVHHKVPRRFIYYHPFKTLEKDGNRLDSLVTLCPKHHQKAEDGELDL